MPIGQIAGVAMKKAAKKITDKMKKKKTGKPKGTGSALGIVGSASKAGMQSKQGKRPKRGINPGRPTPKPRPPKSVFFRAQTTKKPGSKR